MESHRHSQEIRQRAYRHNRLMKMIHNYSRTAEETTKLEKIKSNTMMEINIRYIRCEPNRQYKFPLREEESEDEQEIKYDPFLAKKELNIYDLHSQNSIRPSRSPSKKTISLESSRRVISLEVERGHGPRERLLRLDLKSKHNLSNKNLTRKSSFSQKMMKAGSRIRLPELKIQKYRENLKTEAKAPDEEHEIQSVISKKLITESSDGRKKNGVQKYLLKMEPRIAKAKVKRFQLG